MIPFKNLPISCGVPLLVAKIPSINDDAHSHNNNINNNNNNNNNKLQ